MTDAAVTITQSVVERFTEQYLSSIGCEIEKRGDRWELTVPEEIDSDVLTDGLTLVCGKDIDDEDSVTALHPDSSVFQSILSEASERSPIGKVSIHSDNTATRIPGWLQQSDIAVSASFTPYYDRPAIVVLFRVSIETVSEYQTELLRAVAIDSRSGDSLPTLEQSFLEISAPNAEAANCSQPEINATELQSTIDTAQSLLVERIQGTIDEVHQDASRAANAEIEEFRQLQQQRIEELEEERSSVSTKIERLSDKVSSSDDEERVEALKTRKELKSEYEDINSKLTDLQQRREQGFPDRQLEIRNRHALDVRITPLTITEIEYERGEIEFKLTTEEITRTVSVGYGSGVGVTEEITCTTCDNELDKERPLGSITEGLECSECVN